MLELRTFPSYYIMKFANTRRPYGRVVGMCYEGHEVWMSRDRYDGYIPCRTDRVQLNTSPEFNRRTFAFFLRHLVGDDLGYRCHTYASQIATGNEGEIVPPRKCIDSSPLPPEATLNEGQQAVVMSPQGTITHSMIGLGEADRRCIQVMSRAGPMGLARAADVLLHYNAGFAPPEQNLYSVTWPDEIKNNPAA